MRKLVYAILATFTFIYLIPLFFYGALSVITGLEPPSEGDPVAFMISVAISKIGTAIAFVLIFYLARNVFSGRWLLYAFLWWVMYVFGEIGQAIGPGYTWMMAIGGIISETVYFPLSAYITSRLISEDREYDTS